MDIYIVCGTCGIPQDKKTWIVDAWDSQEEADQRIEELENLKMGLWGDTTGMSSYRCFNQGRIVADKMRDAENGDPNYISDVFSGTIYYTSKTELKSWVDLLAENEQVKEEG